MSDLSGQSKSEDARRCGTIEAKENQTNGLTHVALVSYTVPMARTIRNTNYRPYSCEAKPARKETGRKVRKDARAAIRNGDFDNIPRHRGTEGRITH